MSDPDKLTAFPTEDGWQVSVKQGTGWQVYYGTNIEETIARGLAGGPQHGDDMGDDVWQSRKAPKDGLDDFPTKPWATRAFAHHILQFLVKPGAVIWEPAANRGYMVAALREFHQHGTIIGSDAHDYGVGFPVIDFLTGPTPKDYGQPVDWIVTNPPYNKALEFALRALEIADGGVALLLRSQWLEGIDRYERLFSKHPPSYICQYVERVGFDHGTIGTGRGASMVPYCWFVWDKNADLTWPRVRWIPPSKKDFERESDYGNS